jgi:hypothetical protein
MGTDVDGVAAPEGALAVHELPNNEILVAGGNPQMPLAPFDGRFALLRANSDGVISSACPESIGSLRPVHEIATSITPTVLSITADLTSHFTETNPNLT